MHKWLRGSIRKVAKLSKNNPRRLSVIAVAFIGISTLLISSAATFSISLEPELASISGCARTMADSTASNNTAIKFGSSGNCQLDPSGKTIPVTNYPIPTSNVIFMSTDGNDSNSGTSADRPVLSLAKAVEQVPAGGTIVMRGGEYRQWLPNNRNSNLVGTVSKSVTFQAYPGESPWFNGADIVNSGWQSDGNGRWYRQWETPSFCDGKYYGYSVEPYRHQVLKRDSNGRPLSASNGGIDPAIKQTTCMYEDASNNVDYPVAGNPQQAFIDNIRQQEVETLAKVASGKFYYDWSARRIYIGTNPANKTVELSARPAVMILAGADTNVFTIKGIGFKRYATNGSEGTMTGTPIYAARQTIIENSVFTEMAANGLFVSAKRGSSIRRSVFADNGGTGLTSNGDSKKPGVRNDLLIEDSIFNGNNWERGGLWCNRACGPAHIKMAHMAGFMVRNNIFENAHEGAHALWCDLNCNDMVSVNNIIRNNWGHGVFYEVSNRGIIANNLIYNNGSVGIRVAAPDIKIYNNTIVNNYTPRNEGILIYRDGRPESGDVGPPTNNVQIVNNLIAGPTDRTGARFISPGYSPTGNNFQTSELDYNAYYRISDRQGLYYYTASSQYDSAGEYKFIADMRRLSANRFEGSSFSVDNNESPFINRPNNDYHLKTDSLAYTQKGKPLPADVAAALGVPVGTTPVRGVISIME